MSCLKTDGSRGGGSCLRRMELSMIDVDDVDAMNGQCVIACCVEKNTKCLLQSNRTMIVAMRLHCDHGVLESRWIEAAKIYPFCNLIVAPFFFFFGGVLFAIATADVPPLRKTSPSLSAVVAHIVAARTTSHCRAGRITYWNAGLLASHYLAREALLYIWKQVNMQRIVSILHCSSTDMCGKDISLLYGIVSYCTVLFSMGTKLSPSSSTARNKINSQSIKCKDKRYVHIHSFIKYATTSSPTNPHKDSSMHSSNGTCCCHRPSSGLGPLQTLL